MREDLKYLLKAFILSLAIIAVLYMILFATNQMT